VELVSAKLCWLWNWLTTLPRLTEVTLCLLVSVREHVKATTCTTKWSPPRSSVWPTIPQRLVVSSYGGRSWTMTYMSLVDNGCCFINTIESKPSLMKFRTKTPKCMFKLQVTFWQHIFLNRSAFSQQCWTHTNQTKHTM